PWGAQGDEATVVGAGGGIASAAVVPIGAGGAGAESAREEAGRVLAMAHHPGTGLDQLAVGGDAHAAARWIAGESRGSRDDAVGHQP
ncbi:MAG: hypothetical protein AB8I69_10950, partial [Anaerolineae bacterium]